MLFLLFFALHFHNVAYFKNKSRQRASSEQGDRGQGAGVVLHGKWVLAVLSANGDGNA